MNGLYYYKLVSPYAEDVTKDCKLSINEIDHNFITLKDADIKSVKLSENNSKLLFTRNNGDEFSVSLDGIGNPIKVEYDKENGQITIIQDGDSIVIDGLVTEDNVYDSVVKSISTDGTLIGVGAYKKPLGISPIEKTSSFRAVKKVVNKLNGEVLPNPSMLKKGDRYLTYEKVNEYGYLYDFYSIKRIQDDLRNGWRIPSKEDWDNMLNAVEPCAEDRNHDSIMGNQVLGRYAGKLLKSKDKWKSVCTSNSFDDAIDFDTNCQCGCDSCTCPSGGSSCDTSANGSDAFGLAIVPSGYSDGGSMMDYFGLRGAYWTNTMSHVTDVYVKRFEYNKSGVVQTIENPSFLFSARLVKDFDGSNFQEVEVINGVSYKCVLIPSLNSSHGYMIWTAVNVGFDQAKYRPVEPNNGYNLSTIKKFYINEWSGLEWYRKELYEGDSMVIVEGPDGKENKEYRLINGVLVNILDSALADASKEFNKEIERIDGEIDEIQSDIDGIQKRLDRAEDNISNLDSLLATEISERKSEDRKLAEAITRESEIRANDDKLLKSLIDEESSIRAEADKILDKKIEDEIASREESEEAINEKIDAVKLELQEAIENESRLREEVDNKQWDALNTEVNQRNAVDQQMWASINKEAEDRNAVDAQMWEQLNKEISARTDVDKQIWDSLHVESVNRESVDREIWTQLENEGTIRENVDNEQWEAINKEVERSKKEDEYIKARLIDKEGSVYDCANGILTLKTVDEANNIVIKLTGDYGSF